MRLLAGGNRTVLYGAFFAFPKALLFSKSHCVRFSAYACGGESYDAVRCVFHFSQSVLQGGFSLKRYAAVQNRIYQNLTVRFGAVFRSISFPTVRLSVHYSRNPVCRGSKP